MSTLLSNLIAWLPNLIVAVIIVIIAAAVASAVKDIVSATFGGLTYGRILANIVYGFILALGIIAALNQVGVAVAVTLPVLVAVLATISGILIVGVGGGLIVPMRSRWSRWLANASDEVGPVLDRVTRGHTDPSPKHTAPKHSDHPQPPPDAIL